jgi:hypothetical protein
MSVGVAGIRIHALLVWQRWRVGLGGGRRLVGRCARAWSVRRAVAGVCAVVGCGGAAWVVVVAEQGVSTVSLRGCRWVLRGY